MKRSIKLTSLITILGVLLGACSPFTSTRSQSELQLTPPAQSSQMETKPTMAPSTTAAGSNAVVPSAGTLAGVQGTLVALYQNVSPSVVNIATVTKQTSSQNQFPFTSPFGFNGPQNNNPQRGTPPQVSQALGSGFVWDTNGYIVTNNHVIDGADSITVTFSDGNSVDAKIVGQDVNSDLAVVKIDPTGLNLKPVTVGDSNQVRVGEVSIAIGNPFGLEGTMTEGIISAMGRTLPVDSTANGPSYSIPDIIQTDAAINPGNSGGVLLNLNGEVIGVTSAIESPVRANSGVGFAIPSDIVKRVVPDLVKSGKHTYTYLGLSGTTLTAAMAKGMNLQPTQHGALVVDVSPKGPADNAKLQGSNKTITVNSRDLKVGGDVIIKIGDQTVTRFEDLISYLAKSTDVGQTVNLTVLRDGKEMTVSAKLDARPETAPQAQRQQPQQASSGVYLGISAQNLTPELANAIGLKNTQKGILLEDVQSGSPADKAGLKGSSRPTIINGRPALVGGDVLTAVNGQALASVDDLRSILDSKQIGDVVTMTILREGTEMMVKVTLEGKE